ncbi:MAG: UDP-N-acetylmuramoyl-L-alanine--D-glutamate ligase [Cyanobacteria bacterium HKST-UBA04]|nr:UDP-N-acetylmuramoyl-L-alanine--D-glutamate ligase [Cyanobacteria bacterium HKST-UBA04]
MAGARAASKSASSRFDWQDQPVTILGLSRSGSAVARFMVAQGARCFLSETAPASDANEPLRRELTALGVELEMGGHTAKCFSHAPTVVLSPGIPPTASIIKQLQLSGLTLLSEVELAYRASLDASGKTRMPWVGVTGTNGKTTVVSLLAHILKSAGKRAVACGNIGTPVIEVLADEPDVIVAEFSSFQLTYAPTLQAEVAVMTNFRPDHLDWHGSIRAYKQAKFELFSPAHPPGHIVFNAADAVCRDWQDQVSSPIVWTSATADTFSDFSVTDYLTVDDTAQVLAVRQSGPPKPLLSMAASTLIGRHNQDNMLNAIAAATLLGVEAADIEAALGTFGGVEHRLERLGIIEGVVHYNDSKATNPDATVCALLAFEPKSLILLAGGRDKGTDLSEFVAAVKTYAAGVVLMGDAAPRFAAALQEAGYDQVTTVATLAEAVPAAHKKAQALNVSQPAVLFSPACASFDQFQDFAHRGRVYKDTVGHLAQSANPSPV